MTKKDSTNPAHYIDNERLSSELIDWKEKYTNNLEQGLERPKLPEYVGFAIMKISEHKAQARNFRDYSFIDEMIADGYENVLTYIHNFNPDAVTRSGKVNAFGYISRIIDYAFIARITSEEKQAYFKYKAFEMSGLRSGDFEPDEGIDNSFDINSVGADFMSKVHEYEEKMRLKKAAKDANKKEVIGLTEFMEGFEKEDNVG